MREDLRASKLPLGGAVAGIAQSECSCGVLPELKSIAGCSPSLTVRARTAQRALRVSVREQLRLLRRAQLSLVLAILDSARVKQMLRG